MLYQVEHIVFCMRGQEKDVRNIEDTLPNFDNANHIKKS